MGTNPHQQQEFLLAGRNGQTTGEQIESAQNIMIALAIGGHAKDTTFCWGENERVDGGLHCAEPADG